MLHFFQGNIQHQSMTLRGLLCLTSGISKKEEEQIDKLLEKAEDLLLESERLESIAEIAISAGAPDADVAALAAEVASSAAPLALRNAL